MFKVQIRFQVLIQGCPESGLAAVDFRKANGLPPGPDNRFELNAEFVSEALCREFPGLLDGNADLVLLKDQYSSKPHYTTPEAAKPVVSPSSGYRDGVRYEGLHEVPANLLAIAAATAKDSTEPWEETLPKVVPLLNYLLNAGIASQKEAEKEVARLAAEDAAAQAVRAQQVAQRDVERAAKKAEEEAKLAKLKEWALANGSELVRERIRLGFSWVSEADAEWTEATLDRLGFKRFKPSDTPDGFEWENKGARKAPTLIEMRTLEEVRRRVKGEPVEVDLIWVLYTPDKDDEDYDGEDEQFGRAELFVRTTAPHGERTENYFLVPAEPVTEDDTAGEKG